MLRVLGRGERERIYSWAARRREAGRKGSKETGFADPGCISTTGTSYVVHGIYPTQGWWDFIVGCEVL